MNGPERTPGKTASMHRLRMSFALISLAFGAATMIGGCASSPSDGSRPPLSRLDSNIRAAIANELKRKGYAEAPADTTPDLVVAYETAKADTIKSNPVRVGIGVGSWGSSGGGSVGVGSPSAKNVREGTLVVHAIDPVRKAEVWQGRVTRELGKGTAEPALIHSAVAELLGDFPRAGRPAVTGATPCRPCRIPWIQSPPNSASGLTSAKHR